MPASTASTISIAHAVEAVGISQEGEGKGPLFRWGPTVLTDRTRVGPGGADRPPVTRTRHEPKAIDRPLGESVVGAAVARTSAARGPSQVRAGSAALQVCVAGRRGT